MRRPFEEGVTRRQVLVGGTVLVGAAAAGNYGRYIVGDNFEEHVANVLGCSADVAGHLTELARARLGDFDYEVKAAQFLAVTSFPGGDVAPRRALNKGIGEFVVHLVGDSVENLMLLGFQDAVDTTACTGLLRG